MKWCLGPGIHGMYKYLHPPVFLNAYIPATGTEVLGYSCSYVKQEWGFQYRSPEPLMHVQIVSLEQEMPRYGKKKWVTNLLRVPTVWKGQSSGLFPGFFQAKMQFSRVNLTHWGRDKTADIQLTTFLNTISLMKILINWLKFQWNVFLCVQSIVHQYLGCRQIMV